MKAISLLQPWASLIAIGAKRWETRSWKTSYRGPIAIHASKRFNIELMCIACDENYFLPTLTRAGIAVPSGVPTSAILAVADLTEIITTEEWLARHADNLTLADEATEADREFGDFASNRFAWKLENVRRLKVPVACKGALSLWNVPAETLNAITAQL